MERAISVEIPAIRIRGITKDRSLPVSSMTRTTAETGPWVVADKTAPAPSSAKNPAGTPGQTVLQACPRAAQGVK